MTQKILPKKRTKIVATLGPASNSPEIIGKLIENGVNVFRFNFSHGTHEDHLKLMNIAREEADKRGANIAMLQDLCGPKIRITEVESGEVFVAVGDEVTISFFDGQLGNNEKLYVKIFDPIEVIKVGEKILLADGRVILTAKEILKDGVKCEVVAGGALRSRTGLAVPDSNLNLRCLTKKDLEDLDWGIKNEIDYVALSFVGSPKDVLDLKEEMKKRGASIPIIAKIERAKSLETISDIVAISEGVMVARGDLGLELPLEQVPISQKFIIESANKAGIPAITATEMLQSMVTGNRPTRAEVTDVFTAVRDGTDAVMLSDETAIGKDPVNVVSTMTRILEQAEIEFFINTATKTSTKTPGLETVSEAVCYAATGAANKINATAVLGCTQSGYSARLMAKYRPKQLLFGVTTKKKTWTKMALYWGVIAVMIKLEANDTTEIKQALIELRDQFGIKPGSRVVATAGLQAQKIGSTTVMEVCEIPR